MVNTLCFQFSIFSVLENVTTLLPCYFTLLTSLISAAQFIQEDHGTVETTTNSWQNMEAKFSTLLTNICRTLTEKPINVEDFKMFLKGLFPPECIPKSSTIHEIFEAITCHKLWDYWNYCQLEKVVTRFAADDPEIMSWIEAYKQDLKSYKVTTMLTAHIADSDYKSSEEKQPAKYDQQYYQTLSVKLKGKLTGQTLIYIDNLWSDFAELCGLPPYVALFDHIQKGCVSIVWLIPSHLAPQIRSAASLSGDFYRKHKITRVELAEKCIYQEGEKHHKVYIPVLNRGYCTTVPLSF